MRLRGRHYRTGEPIDVVTSGPRIEAVGPATSAPADLKADWIAPGFCDVQINGALGLSFGSPMPLDDYRRIVRKCRSHGITELCPTVITASAEDLLAAFTHLTRACETDAELKRAFLGYHLEGPFLSPEDGPRGAHPKAHIRNPNWDEFRRLQDAAAGRIRMVTLAPERPGALDLIEQLTASKVIVAIGHTAATPAQIRDAIRAGARVSTHLGNGSHALLPRHENYLWEQLAADELWASVIADGHHLPPALLKSIVRVKTPSRLLLTCDSSPLAGQPPGRYRQWETDIDILPEGKIVVAGTPFLAGSGDFTDACVRHILGFLPFADAIDLASSQPRRLLGLPPRTLEPGHPADVILADRPFEIRSVVVGGKTEPLQANASSMRARTTA